MIAALGFFLLGAVVGIVLAIHHFTKRRLPASLAVVHGLAGATGFALLLLFVLRRPDFVPAKLATAILIVAVTFGCVNAVYHVRGRRHRSFLVVTHALMAVSGVGTLAYGIVLSAAAERNVPIETPDAGAAPSLEIAASAAAPSPLGVTAIAPIAPIAPSTPSPTTLSVGPAFRETSITFDGNSTTLGVAAQAALSSIADELKRNSDVRLVEIQGHADPRGDDRTNVTLARARARVVMESLVSLGVASSRLRGVGYGARCPRDAACTAASCPPESLANERRVDFLVLESGTSRYRGEVACVRAADLIPREDAPYRVVRNPAGGDRR